MATNSMPVPDQQGGSPQGGPPPPPPDGGGQHGPPSQGPANQIQQLLGKWSQAAQEIAQAYPQIASELNKIVQAIGEAQTKLIAPPQPTPTSQQPSYS
jgi:hypothetical protein